MISYNYSHREGVDEITWERFAELAATLAEKLAAQGVDTIVGIARAGLFPATQVSLMLRCELYPMRVTRRVAGIVTYEHPVWKVDVSQEVAGRNVAVVDEIADAGETMKLVAERVRERGAAKVITASLVTHPWANPRPDVVALVSDAFIIFPWDKRVYMNGEWRPDPEVEEGLRAQK